MHAAAPALGGDGHDHAADGSLLADVEIADAARGREVVVAERVVDEQVVDGRDPERLVASELLVADPEPGVLERCLRGRRGWRRRPRLRPRAAGRWLRGCRRLCWRWCACGRRRSVAGQARDLGVQPRGSRGGRELAVACRREPRGKLLHLRALPRLAGQEGVEAADDRAIMAATGALEVEDSRQPLCSEPAPCRCACRRHHLAVVPSARALSQGRRPGGPASVQHNSSYPESTDRSLPGGTPGCRRPHPTQLHTSTGFRSWCGRSGVRTPSRGGHSRDPHGTNPLPATAFGVATGRPGSTPAAARPVPALVRASPTRNPASLSLRTICSGVCLRLFTVMLLSPAASRREAR